MEKWLPRKPARSIPRGRVQVARLLDRGPPSARVVAAVGHELRAPLDAVEGYLHIIRDRSAGHDPKAYDLMLDRCLTRTQFMRKMVNDLLDMARIESGQRRLLWWRPALRDKWAAHHAERRAELLRLFRAQRLRPLFVEGAFDAEAVTRHFHS